MIYYKEIKKPGPKDAYIIAYYLRQKDSKTAEAIVAPFAADTSCAKLYAALLAKNGKYAASAEQYNTLLNNKKLDGAGRVEYAKVLYRLENWKAAYDQAIASNKYQGFYIAGLCKYNQAEYRAAYEQLTKYINSKNTTYQNQRFAQYYRAVCLYKTSDYKNAYKILTAFI